MKLASLITAAGLLAVSSVLAGPTPIKAGLLKKRWNDGFVKAQGRNFTVNDQPFFFLSENVYWLTQVNEDCDVVKALKNIQAGGANAIRLWCFREVVGEAPSNPATYTSLWQNGNRTFNQDGVDRIKLILDTAQSLGIYAQCVLNNNWAPTFPANSSKPLGYYSNSYGGIDTYVQQIIPGGHHDDFYTNSSIFQAYNDFLSFIVPQFANHTALLAWELVNDLRCQGAAGTTTSSNCNPQTITLWVKQAAACLRKLDCNHLITSGDSGFLCVGCPKINTPSASRRGLSGGFDWDKLRRQTGTTAGAYNGAAGVDSEDIANDPNIGASTFQMQPDQNNLSSGTSTKRAIGGPPSGGTGGANFNSTLETGNQWILAHVNAFSKPLHLTSFGLVNSVTAKSFVPFGSTILNSVSTAGQCPPQQFATVQQQGTAYTSWLNIAVNNGVNGIGHYQNTQTGLTSVPGSVIDDANTAGDDGTQSPGESPEDGYQTTSSSILSILGTAASSQNAKSGSNSS